VIKISQRLSDDHHAVDEVLKQLRTALDTRDLQTSNSKLDLLWARLAVHIRAEHLNLFPAVASEFSEAQSVIDHLRADHDFFMHELARAMSILRELSDESDLTAVGNIVREVEKRLATHNDIEENHIYRLAGTMLTKPKQIELATRVNAELENRPPRFSPEAWANND